MEKRRANEFEFSEGTFDPLLGRGPIARQTRRKPLPIAADARL
jgi:hypothetical protein